MCCGKSVSPKRVVVSRIAATASSARLAAGTIPEYVAQPVRRDRSVSDSKSTSSVSTPVLTSTRDVAANPGLNTDVRHCPVCRQPLSIVNVGGTVRRRCFNPACRYEI